MSRGPEAAFWKRVRAAWCGHAVRIEASDSEVDPGTPDCVLSIGWRGGFIELKVWSDDVSPVQLAWHVDAISRGAYAMVLSELPDGSVWLGSAENYFELTEAKQVPEGTSLHSALGMVQSALLRASSLKLKAK